MNEASKLVLAYQKIIKQLKAALDATSENFHLGTVTELNNQLTRLLMNLNKNREVSQQLSPQLHELYLSHQALLAKCQQKSEALKINMENYQKNKEGLLAYETVGVQK